ncbi:hypothetical protein BJ912DRAFT_983123 [Pholiota molesta]|nr:hypothetical protein BJ912DRAFT_983123 [Pholiota molesta]
MALPDDQAIAALNNVESPHPTRPVGTDANNESSALFASPSSLYNIEGSRSPVRPTLGDLGSNNSNSNSGNQNAIVMGGTTVDTSANMFMAPGRDLIMNNYISMDQLSKILELNSLKESSREHSNFDSSLHRSTPASTADSPISLPIYGRTNRPYSKSLAPAAKSHIKRVTPENLKKHIPTVTHDRIVDYMTSDLFNSTIAIPLCRPSPSLFDSIVNHTQNWTRNIYLGDVGSEKSNKSRHGGHVVPSNFIPYHKKLSEMSIQEDWCSEQSDKLRAVGFTKDVKVIEGNESVTLRFPINSAKDSCSALHMRDGFRCLRISSSEERGLKEYFRSQQRADLDVTATSSKKVGRIGQQRIYSWAPEDNKVLARSGPSGEHIEKIGTYLRTLAEGSEVVRKELEECHVVAVEAFYLHERTGSLLGRSIRTNNTNRSHQTITQRAVASVRNFFR